MYSVAYSPDGAKIISCSEDIRNWNAQSATMHRNMKQVCIQTWKGSQFSWLIIERSQFMEELTVCCGMWPSHILSTILTVIPRRITRREASTTSRDFLILSLQLLGTNILIRF